MTTKELECKVDVSHGRYYGTYGVRIEFRGRFYSCASHNSMAWDRMLESRDADDRKELSGYTYKGALMAFYDECKRKNHLGEYAY